MVKLAAMPFESRSFDPQAFEVLDEIVTWTEAMRAAEAERAHAASKRANAIVAARGHGMPLDVIAKRLGVTRQRVQEMEKRPTGRAAGASPKADK